MILDELLIALGFVYDPSEMKEYKEDIKETTDLLKKYALAVIAGTATLVGFVAVTTEATDRQGKLANQLGTTVDNIDALEHALGRAGGDSKQLGSNLEQLAIRIAEANRGMGTGVEAFGILGLDPGQLGTVDDAILRIADRMQGFSRAEQIELADKLGLRDSILLLQEGSAGIAELTSNAKALGTTTAEDARIAAQFQDSLLDIWRVIGHISRVLVRTLGPMLQQTADWFLNWWKANREIIEQNVPGFIEKVIIGLKILSLAMAAIIASKLPAFIAALVGSLKALTAWPVAIAAAMAGLILLFKDAQGFFQGQESFIGDMIQKYPQWEKQLTSIAAVFAAIADTIDLIWTGMNEIYNLFTKTDFTGDFKFFLEAIGKDISDFFSFGGGGDKTSPSGIGEDVLSSNSSANMSIGDINVSVGAGADGKVIGEEVASTLELQLEPILKQTSRDLNSSVVA